MVKHNNIIPNQHFRKQWTRRVKTWFDQPAQKKVRRARRQEKAAAIAPRPASGALRPVVQCPTQKYNTKSKLGRGFTLDELKEAGVNRKFARTIGIVVDHRRTNKCVESLQLNAQRLKDYMQRVAIFPKKASKVTQEFSALQQHKGDVVPVPAASPAVTFAAISEEMKDFNGYTAVRDARNEASLVGIRLKKSKEEKKDKKDEE